MIRNNKWLFICLGFTGSVRDQVFFLIGFDDEKIIVDDPLATSPSKVIDFTGR